jgi:hypothetical protein
MTCGRGVYPSGGDPSVHTIQFEVRRCLCLRAVGAGCDAGVAPLPAAQGHELLAFRGCVPRSDLLRIDARSGHHVDGQAHQSEIPADADCARAELRPLLIVDVRDVSQLERVQPSDSRESRSSIQLTSPPYSQVATKLRGGSQRPGPS